MATFKRFEEIESWKKARELTTRIYRISNAEPFAKDFGLKDQIRRASVSIMSNIGEGHDRSSTREVLSVPGNCKRAPPQKFAVNVMSLWTRATSTRPRSGN